MPRRQSTRSRNVSSPKSSKPARRSGWIHRLLSRASTAGLNLDCSYGMEPLETRTMLTTFNNFGQGVADSQFFFTGQNQVAQLTYFDVDFEAIAVFVDPKTGAATLGDPIGASTPEPKVGANFYKFYVAESSSDSFITVTVTSGLGAAGGGAPVPTPFAGGIPALAVTNAQTGAGYAAASPGVGGILIGAVNPLTKPLANTPIAVMPLTTPFGLQPAPVNGALTPGIEVAPTDPFTGLQNDFGEFYVGGTVTGSVEFGGNVNEFYAGAVLTGNIFGDFTVPLTAPTGSRSEPGNFFVAGDLNDFLVAGNVGTDGVLAKATDLTSYNYVTSFDLDVSGKLGEVHVGGSFAGTIEAGNSPNISGQTPYPVGTTNPVVGSTIDQLEVEAPTPGKPDETFTGLDGTPGLSLAVFGNNTNDTAQILGSIPEIDSFTGLPVRDANGNILYKASVDGFLDNVPTATDNIDTYAIPMLAGSTFDAQINIPLGEARLEVMDPDGRVIASNSRSGVTPFQVTADRPGLYYFQVSIYRTPSLIELLSFDYNLTVSNIGNMAIGGIHIVNNYDDIGVDAGIIAGNGDLGAIVVDGSYVSTTFGPTPITTSIVADTSILVAAGNLRDLTAGSIGFLVNANNFGDGPILSVPNGSIGLIDATSATGILDLETQFDPNSTTLKTDDAFASAIGGNIQVIKAAGTFFTDLAVNGGIGTIQAANMATLSPSFIDVNADNTGNDGIIDLIDVTGDFGTLAGGGPGIVTNSGGNVRYMTVGGTVFRDAFFGGGIDTPITYAAGQVVNFTDAAGNILTITPVGLVTTTTVKTVITPSTNASTGSTNTSASTTTTSTTSGPAISILSYGIRDKGGEVPLTITAAVTGTALNTSTGASLTIKSSGTGGTNSQVNIGSITISGTGSPIVPGPNDQFGNPTVSQTPVTLNASSGSTATTTSTTNPDGSTTTVTTTISGAGTSTDLSLLLSGSAPINVLSIVSTGDATLIENDTRGEVASVTSPDVGQILVHGNLGFTTPQATPSVDLPSTVITNGNTYPFVQQHTGVVISGDAVNIDAYGGIGNVEVLGTLQSLIANFAVSSKFKGAVGTPGQFNGIVGPIYGGSLLNIDIGQGILPTGSGSVGFSGIFAIGTIGLINNTGNPNGDIRGNIVSEGGTTTNTSIGAITLGNASIIYSHIVSLGSGDFSQTDDLFGDSFPVKATTETPFASPYIYEIGSITITGAGGIIGSSITAANLGPVVVGKGGFGVLGTSIVSVTTGRVAGITAAGYGIRNSNISDGSFVGPIVATGNGSLLSVLAFPIDLRHSDIANSLDPYFGITPNGFTDLDVALGVTGLAPNVPNVTDTGVVQDCFFEGQETFGGLTAQKVRTIEPLTTNSVLNIPTIGQEFPMEINFPASVGKITVFKEVDGLEITTGHLVGFAPSTSVNRVGISVAGPIGSIVIHGNFGKYVTDPATGLLVPDSYLSAGGPSGTIGMLQVLGNMNANVYATGQIYNMVITGDLEGAVVASGSTQGLALGNLRVGGGIRDNSLILEGNVGSIVVGGSLGTAAGTLTVHGNANLISVGATHSRHGAQLALALVVDGTLKNLTVFGTITGTVSTQGDLNKIALTDDGSSPNAISGSITVGGRLGSANVVNGNVAGNIVVNNNIGTFTITRGNLNAGISLQSMVGNIGMFRITGGLAFGAYGSILALESNNENIDISGSLGDGVNAVTVTANSGNTFRVRGNVAALAVVAVTTSLNLLRVDGSVLAGAVISAHPLKKQKILGTDNGVIITV